MQLSTFNPTQISNAVWTAAARTLTADPATDLGAAKLVWDRTTVAPAAGGFGALVNLNLDAKVSLQAVAATALSTAVWTNGRGALLDNLDAAISTRLSTTSNGVQYGTATMTAGNGTATATISAVGTKAVLGFLGFDITGSADIRDGNAYATLTNTTTVTVTRTSTTGTCVVSFVVDDRK